MKNINKILAVSFIAMLAVPAAQAKIVSETMLTSEAGHYSKDHTVQSEINAKQDTLVPGTNIEGAGSVTVTKDATSGKITVTGAATDISGKQDKLNSGTGGNVVAGTATGNVVTSITASNGTVTVNKASGAIKNIDIASDAAIAKTKLASDVQTSLGKADSSVQSVSLAGGTNNGTVKLTVNGTTTDNIPVHGLGSAAYKNVISTYSATGTDPVSGTAVADAISNLNAAGTYEETAYKSTSTKAVADSTNGSLKDTKYPTVAGARAIAEDVVSGASGNYVPTSRKVNSKVLSADITLDGSDVKVKTGYAKKTGNVAAGDTIDAAIGKLETKADNAATTASNAATAAAAAQTTADGKVTANTDIAPSGTSYKIVQYDKKGLVTAGKSLEASDIPTLPESKITNLTTDLAAKQTTANMVAIDTDQGSTLTKTQKESKTTYPSMSTVTAMVNKNSEDLTDAIGMKVDKQQAEGQENKAMITNASGQVVPGQIASDMIADSAVTSAKIANSTIVNADISNSAAITTNKMGAITGYAKATTNESLAATDTLNTALGKLEKKADDAATAAANAKNGVTATGSNGVTADASNGAITVSGTAATTGAVGVVQLADAAAITAGTAGRVVDAAQLKTVADSVTTTNNNKQDKLSSTNVKVKSGDNGNVVTAVTAANGVVTVAKGMTAIPEPTATNATGTLVLTAKPKTGGGYDYQWEELGR